MAVQRDIAELIAVTGGRVVGDPSTTISGIASIEDAGPGDITFVADARHMSQLKACRASAVIMKDPGTDPDKIAGDLALLLVDNPMLAAAKVLQVFSPLELPPPGIHPRAEVHPEALVGPEVSIGPMAVIEEGAEIGERTILMAGVYVGRDAHLGADSVIYPGVVIRDRCIIGARAIIHPNAVIGSDGFGFTRDGAKSYKIPQNGIVRIGDDVEIGACSTVDRGTMGETLIESGTKIDNLVQVAHNVRIGAGSIIVAQVGIAGSSTIGKHVVIAGQSGVSDHITIGDRATVGTKTAVLQDMAPGAVHIGIPAIPRGDWLRSQSIFAKLPELKKKLKELEERVGAIEGSKDI